MNNVIGGNGIYLAGTYGIAAYVIHELLSYQCQFISNTAQENSNLPPKRD